jgi:phosphohistidine swiveling domain-containing protein
MRDAVAEADEQGKLLLVPVTKSKQNKHVKRNVIIAIAATLIVAGAVVGALIGTGVIKGVSKTSSDNAASGSSLALSFDMAKTTTLSRRAVGISASGSLQTLKMFITNVQLCKSFVQRGSGYSSTSGCLQLYNSPNEPGEKGAYLVADATADQTNYVDMLDSTDRARLSVQGNIDSESIGSYTIMIIRFARPVKFKASVVHELA